jgi:hypothetical protein
MMAFALVGSSAAYAQASRTWVSGVGDDVNPCSRTAPCKTFAGAISKTAISGEINALDPGGYGAVTITKSITISGEGTNASILAAGTNGIIINASSASTIILRNIGINGVGTGLNGIRFLNGGELHLEKVVIYGFTQQGLEFAPPGAGKLFITNSSFRDNSGGGLWSVPGAAGTALVTINGSSFEGNQRGVRADDATTMFIQNSSLSGNVANGLVTFSSTRPVKVAMDGGAASNNGAAGIRALTNTTIRLSAVSILGNLIGLEAAGGSLLSFGNNRVAGNGTDGAPTGPIPSM